MPSFANDALVGAWRLERYVDTIEGETPVYGLGENPVGMMIFTKDGHVSINLMRIPTNAEPAAPFDANACNPNWYCSQFGAYTADEKKGAFTIEVTGSNIPAFLGSQQTRPFVIKKDKLIIAGEYSGAEGKTARFERVFVRE
jgi:hypothetical protein